ncbi:MAG: hypothetical protein JXL84_22260, partial [Deltaproteobacteria bacterium]|nr:hypothetical protein [Deltaproteobacteria bacterium]
MLLRRGKITEEVVRLILSWPHSGFNVHSGSRIQPRNEEAMGNLATCPKCSGKMKIISVIEDEEVIKRILKHLGLWEVKLRPPPKATGPPRRPEYRIDYSTSQLPPSDKWPAYQVRGRFMWTRNTPRRSPPDFR